MKNLLFTLFLFLFTLIAIGFSKSYTIDQININAIVLPDGNIEINETRTYTFKGKFSWAEYQLPLDKLGEVKLFSLRESSQNYYKSNDELPGSYYIENKGNTFYVQAGAGIVADSDPAREYEESVNKAKALAVATPPHRYARR